MKTIVEKMAEKIKAVRTIATPAPVVKAPAPAPVAKQTRVLYTIRLEPNIVAAIEKLAEKRGVTHAVIAREMLHAAIKK